MKKHHFRDPTKMIRQNAEIRLYTLPSKKNGFYANNYLFTIMDIIFLFSYSLSYSERRFGFFWFNLVKKKANCFFLVQFGFYFNKIFKTNKFFTNFLLTFD